MLSAATKLMSIKVIPSFIVIICFSLGIYIQSDSVEGPVLQVNKTIYDLGEVVPNKKYFTSLELYNFGTADLIIDNVRSCCGVECRIDPKIIKPLASGKLEISAYFADSKNIKRVFIESNDLVNPNMTVMLKAHVIKSIDGPSQIDAGKISSMVPTLISFKLKNNTGSKLQIEGSDFFSILSVLKNENDYEVNLMTRSGIPPGYLKDEVIVKLGTPVDQSIRIPLFFHVTGDIQVAPNVLKLNTRSTPNKLTFVVQTKTALNVDFPLKYKSKNVTKLANSYIYEFLGVSHNNPGNFMVRFWNDNIECSSRILVSTQKYTNKNLSDWSLKRLQEVDFREQTMCPYTRTPIKSHFYYDISGYRIFTCCIPCLAKVRKNPDQALLKILSNKEQIKRLSF